MRPVLAHFKLFSSHRQWSGNWKEWRNLRENVENYRNLTRWVLCIFEFDLPNILTFDEFIVFSVTQRSNWPTWVKGTQITCHLRHKRESCYRELADKSEDAWPQVAYVQLLSFPELYKDLTKKITSILLWCSQTKRHENARRLQKQDRNENMWHSGVKRWWRVSNELLYRKLPTIRHHLMFNKSFYKIIYI